MHEPRNKHTDKFNGLGIKPCVLVHAIKPICDIYTDFHNPLCKFKFEGNCIDILIKLALTASSYTMETDIRIKCDTVSLTNTQMQILCEKSNFNVQELKLNYFVVDVGAFEISGDVILNSVIV